MISFNDFIQKTQNRKPLYGYRLDNRLFCECIAESCKDVLNISNLEFRNLVYSSSSLNQFRRRFDDCEYISESHFKTFPVQKFAELFVKTISREFNVAVNFIPNEGQSFTYGLNGIDYTNQTCVDSEKLVLIKAFYRNFDGKIPDIVDFEIYMDNSIGCIKPDMITGKLLDVGVYCGYDYVSHNVDPGYDGYRIFSIVFESRHKDTPMTVNRKLYHVAPFSVKNRILKYGIEPKSKSINRGTNINHPDRVYMFNRELSVDQYKQFVKAARKKSNAFKSGEFVDERKYVVFEIDVDSLANVKLFRDGMFKTKNQNEPLAVYTYSNIPPSALSVAFEFSV